MKKILLVYLPFCTPASPPYSLTYLYSFLKDNSEHQIDILDLNLEFHKLKFPKYQEYYHNTDWDDYQEKTSEYHKLTSDVYAANNKGVVKGEKPELFKEMLQKIKDKKPDIVAFSIIYSSQAFYAFSLLKELKSVKNIKTVIGGPAVNEKLIKEADEFLGNEIELLEYIQDNPLVHDKLNCSTIPDFSIHDLKAYFTPKPIIPIKTSTTCFYKGCTFCNHFSNSKYFEYPLEQIKETIIKSKQKHFFFIDDMIPTKRLLKIAEILKPLKVKWTCQLRPTKDLDFKTLKTLRDSGLTMIMWGIESGNDRILGLIRKGTNSKDIAQVLNDSHKAGIKNIAYIIFGFPSETKEELLETIEFMQKNEESIDLVSTSIFGLQKNTYIYNNPKEFGITKIHEEQRTVLEPRITYEVSKGLTQNQANKIRDSYKKTIDKLNKYPKTMNFFREHMFCLS